MSTPEASVVEFPPLLDFPAPRLRAYPRETVSRLLGNGRIFEYWAHEACLLPIQDYPLFKRRMEHLANEHWWGRKRQARDVEENIEPHGGHVPILAGFEG